MYVNHPLVPGRLPTKVSLSQRLHIRAAGRRPPLADLHIRHRGAFAYSAGQVTDGEDVPLMRLRSTGSATHRGFALHLASNGRYLDTLLPTGTFTGTPEEALDCVCERNLSTPDS
ncbi:MULTISPECIES: hypothetical protein [unclassified Frankia]|uniref:hypothetical protein n=1 Tax=unclassified Frankia TaxID=2632575 RepID=UPI002AD1F840|nr:MULTISPECIES: hypothetical protein [unclassified Frankia]